MPRRILIVEDDKLLANKLRDIIEFQGFEAEIAHTGPAGIEAFEARPADLVLAAVMLPGIHGLRVIEAIRDLDGGADIPVFLTSAVYRTPKMFAADMERLRVEDFLAKPFSLNDLALRIEGLLLGVGDAPAFDDLPPPPAPTLEEDLRGGPWGHSPGDSFLPVDTGRHLPAEGDLTPERYVQAITTLFHSHSSGRLHLTAAGAERVLYFLNGYPVWVQVAAGTPGLAQWLVDEQILVEADLQQVQGARSARSWSTRKALLELSLVSPGDLPPLMEGWVADVLMNGLHSGGRFTFEPSDDFAARIPVYEVNPIRVIWDGVRTKISKRAAERDLERWAGSWLGKTKTFARLYGYLPNSGMFDLPDFLSTPRSLQEVRSRYQDPDGTVAKCLWLMVHAGLLGISEAPRTTPSPAQNLGPKPGDRPRRRPASHVHTRRFGAEAVEALRQAKLARPTPPKASGTSSADQILKDYLTKIDEDHYAFLGVTRLASRGEIEGAYDRLAARYRTAGTSIQGDARRKAKELLAHLVSAYEELRDPQRRELYDEQLRRKMLGIETPVDPFLDVAEISGFEIPSVSEIWEGESLGTTETIRTDRLFDDNAGYPPVMSEGRLDQLGARMGPHGPAWIQARRHMMSGDMRRAYLILDQLRGQLPDDPTVLADLGWARFVLADGDYDSIQTAIEWADLALTFAPRHLGGAEVRARILCRPHSDATPEEQRRALDKLLQLSPGLPWAETRIAAHRTRHDTDEKDRSGGLRGLFRRKK